MHDGGSVALARVQARLAAEDAEVRMRAEAGLNDQRAVGVKRLVDANGRYWRRSGRRYQI
jgi:hypothetical protein